MDEREGRNGTQGRNDGRAWYGTFPLESGRKYGRWWWDGTSRMGSLEPRRHGRWYG